MKHLLKFSLLFLFFAGNAQNNNSLKAEKWLIKTIEKFFSENNTEEIFTKEYNEYKQDAINVAYETDESLTEEAFHDKWKNKFDTKYAGIGAGFIISGQDWNIIKVTQCKLLSKTNNTHTFKVVIEDIGEGYGQKYNRDIVVKEKENSFIISDIKEYN